MVKKAKQNESGLDGEVKELKREWKHFRRFKDENHLLFAAFVIVLTSLVVLNAFYVISKNRNNEVVVSNDANQVLTSLQSGNNPSQKVTISNVSENDKMDYAFTIDPSETMLILDVSITNTSSATKQLIPVNQFFVRTSQGETAALHASMYVTNPLKSEDLAPGQTAKGQISFNVPKREAKPLLYVDTGWDNYVPIVFDVLH